MRGGKMKINKIKWKKIANIASEVAGEQITIHGSTELPSDISSYVQLLDEKCEILLNLNVIKSDEQILESLAHELAHLKNGSTVHDIRFADESAYVLEKLQDRYYEGEQVDKELP
jgi:predicted metal-dependent hydrolase